MSLILTPGSRSGKLKGSTRTAFMAPPESSRGRRPARGTSVAQSSSSSTVQQVNQASSTLCDDSLERLDISFWTDVKVTSDFAAHAISTFLDAEYAFAGFFEAELFLADLVAHRQRYCSVLLVNAVLFHACVRHTRCTTNRNS